MNELSWTEIVGGVGVWWILWYVSCFLRLHGGMFVDYVLISSSGCAWSGLNGNYWKCRCMVNIMVCKLLLQLHERMCVDYMLMIVGQCAYLSKVFDSVPPYRNGWNWMCDVYDLLTLNQFFIVYIRLASHYLLQHGPEGSSTKMCTSNTTQSMGSRNIPAYLAGERVDPQSLNN